MKLLKYSVVALLLLILLTATPLLSAEPGFPVPAARDKCPVCGMFVSKYPEWVASITYKNQPALFFDGAKDLFTYYLNPQKYAAKGNPQNIRLILVKDYYALKPINAQKALFVIGSNVYGPMGKELVPFEKMADAREFMKDHKGTKILRFEDVNLSVLNSLE
jgi:copper chaperone NosL